MASITEPKVTSLETLNVFLKNRNTSENTFYLSSIPEACKTLPCILGIDEAGRGPVLGPMVYGTAFCPLENEDHLKLLECADSKALTEKTRDSIFSKICESANVMGWAVEIISPNTICNGMLRRTKHSLNAISMDSAVGLIKAAEKAAVNISHVYVDTVGKPEKYQDYLCKIFPHYKITVAKKADATYPIVSAASICAKVARDHALEVWTFPENLHIEQKDFGSGYPGDPVTKKFLTERCDSVFGFPQLVRFSWSTAANVLEQRALEVEWDDPETETTTSNNTSITTFFKMVNKKDTKKRIRHEFFVQCGLSDKTDF